jgi:hypothetical protein
MSRVGRKVIPIPKGVELKISGRLVTAKGPKGELSREIREGLELDVAGTEAHVRQTVPGRQAGALFGLTRALINNMVLGVSAGFTKALEIHGTDAGRSPGQAGPQPEPFPSHRIPPPRASRRSGSEPDRATGIDKERAR